MKRTLLSVAIGLATQTAFAAEALDTLHIEASNEIGLTNSAARINEADSSATIDAEDIEARQANNFSEIMQHVPSVMVEQQSGQQGSIIYVRGMRGDQVSVRVDGAPKNFTQTRHGGADALYFDTNMYKTVSVIPGVSSNTYGSGSLGGVVLIETKDPEDIIKEDKSWGAALRYGHETNGQANTLSADLAKRFSDTFSANATITGKQFDPYKDGQGVSSEEGHTGTDDLGLLLKGVITPSSEHRVELSTLTNTKEYTAPGSGSSTSVYDTEVLDRTYAAEYSFTPANNPWINLDARVSQATTERDRKTYQSDEDWTTWGVTTNFFELNNTSEFEQGERIFHVVKIGADYTHDDITSAYTSSTTGDLLKRKRTTKGAYLSAFSFPAIQTVSELYLIAVIAFLFPHRIFKLVIEFVVLFVMFTLNENTPHQDAKFKQQPHRQRQQTLRDHIRRCQQHTQYKTANQYISTLLRQAFSSRRTGPDQQQGGDRDLKYNAKSKEQLEYKVEVAADVRHYSDVFRAHAGEEAEDQREHHKVRKCDTSIEQENT